MKFEVRSINPLSVLINAARIFSIIGFVVSALGFYSSPRVIYASFGVKLLATLRYTIVYTLIVSLTLAAVAWLYNHWAKKYRGIIVDLQQR